MSKDTTSTPGRGRSAEVARYAVLAGLIDQLEKAADYARERAKSVYLNTWYSGEEAAFRKAIAMARQCQHNAQS